MLRGLRQWLEDVIYDMQILRAEEEAARESEADIWSNVQWAIQKDTTVGRSLYRHVLHRKTYIAGMAEVPLQKGAFPAQP